MWEQIQPFAYGIGFLVLAIGFVWGLAAIAKKITPGSGSASSLQGAILFLSVFEDALASTIGEQWKTVYDAILQALKSIADGVISETEAEESAKEVFNAAISLSKATLTEDQKALAYKVLAKAVQYVISNKTSSAAAVATTLSLKK